MKKVMKKRENEVIIVKCVLGETAESLLEHVEGNKFRFKTDAWCLGEPCKGGFLHLRQAIPVRPGQKLTTEVIKWPRLRSALRKEGIEAVCIPGGNHPLHYRNEIAVPVSGSHYFIVKRKDIGKYLDAFPLDEAGLRHKAEIEAKEAERLRRENSPEHIAENIGDMLNDQLGLMAGLSRAEFCRVTLLGEGGDHSVIYPEERTNLADEVKGRVVMKPLATDLDPERFTKPSCKRTLSREVYLTPDPRLADEVRETCHWLRMFRRYGNFDGTDPARIAAARDVVLEGFDLHDDIIPERLVYRACDKEVHAERLLDGTWTE